MLAALKNSSSANAVNSQSYGISPCTLFTAGKLSHTKVKQLPCSLVSGQSVLWIWWSGSQSVILPTSLDFQAKSLYYAILRGRTVCWLLFYCCIKTLRPKQLIRAHIQTANTKQRWQIEMMGLLNSQNLPPGTDVIQPGHACLLNLLNTNLGAPCVHMPETMWAFSFKLPYWTKRRWGISFSWSLERNHCVWQEKEVPEAAHHLQSPWEVLSAWRQVSRGSASYFWPCLWIGNVCWQNEVLIAWG